MRSLIFRLHGWLGISAGLIITIVGLSGALLAFEPQILKLINPGVLTVHAPSSAMRLSPDALYAEVLAAAPERIVQALTLSNQAGAPAQVVFQTPGKPRGQSVWLQPYSGELMPHVRGVQGFDLIESLHRKLLLDAFGKALTGASAIVLVLMAISGLYMRWLRRPPRLTNWFVLRKGLKGKALHWQLHGVVGTWCLVFFLFSAGTGLLWSYDVYKAGVYNLLSVPLPVPVPERKALQPSLSASRFGELTQPAWQTFLRQHPDYLSASIIFAPLAKNIVKIDFVLASADHPREKNTLLLNTAGQVISLERFTDKPWGERITASWKLLHTGQYWGWIGQLVLSLSSLSLGLFSYTGLRLYFSRQY